MAGQIIEYASIRLYLTSAQDKCDQIEKIDQIIDALYDAALKAAENQDLESYTLDDGQTKITNHYRDAASISRAIDIYEKLRERLINKIDGRMIVLKDFESTKHLNRYY